MLFNAVLVQSIVLLAALILVPALLVLTAWLALRRALGRSNSLLRVEVVGTPGAFALTPVAREQAAPGGANLPGSVAAAAPPLANPPARREEEYTAQPFELGSTDEEEMRLKEHACHQQEEALLRRVFEENVRLREQLV
jgi:hypothetical protein